MPGDHFAVSVDEDRNIEAERLDALGDLADLFGAVLTSVARVGLQLIDRQVGDRQLRAVARGYKRILGHVVFLDVCRPQSRSAIRAER